MKLLELFNKFTARWMGTAVQGLAINEIYELQQALDSVDKSNSVYDLDRMDWELIKQAANESKWMPPEYMRNDWVSDLCDYLRNGHPDKLIVRKTLTKWLNYLVVNKTYTIEQARGRAKKLLGKIDGGPVSLDGKTIGEFQLENETLKRQISDLDVHIGQLNAQMFTLKNQRNELRQGVRQIHAMLNPTDFRTVNPDSVVNSRRDVPGAPDQGRETVSPLPNVLTFEVLERQQNMAPGELVGTVEGFSEFDVLERLKNDPTFKHLSGKILYIREVN